MEKDDKGSTLIRIGVSGESSFWYRPTRVVPDQRPLNGRCCSLLVTRSKTNPNLTLTDTGSPTDPNPNSTGRVLTVTRHRKRLLQASDIAS